MSYILVYNEERFLEAGHTRQSKEGIKRQKVNRSQSEHRTNLYKNISKLAKEEFILFGLDQFKNYLFKNVHTYTVKEFQQNFIDSPITL